MSPIRALRERAISRAAEVFTRLRQLDEDVNADLAIAILQQLDTACRQKLIRGEPQLFASIGLAWAAFGRQMRVRAQELGLEPHELEDPILMEELFQRVLHDMVDQGELVFAGDRLRLRSRVFETVHYLRSLRQRLGNVEKDRSAPRLVEMLKVEVRERMRPVRSCHPEDLIESVSELSASIHDWREFTEPLPLEEAREKIDGIFSRFLESTALRAGLSGFQVRAFRELLQAAFLEDGPEGFAIAAGTGFGKTEAFLLPVLYYSVYVRFLKMATVNARKKKDHGDRDVSGILLYPRRDLCNNQAERLLGYLFHLNRQLLAEGLQPLRVALAHGDIEAEDLRIECPACQEDKRKAQADWKAQDEARACLSPKKTTGPNSYVKAFECQRAGEEHSEISNCLVPNVNRSVSEADLVVATIDTLHRRLMDKSGQARIFGPKRLPPRFVVMDEIHIYEGQPGAHAAGILRRCKRRIETMSEGAATPVFVGASATTGNPEETVRRMFGIRSVKSICPDPDTETRKRGLEYFVFVQSPGNRLLTLGPSSKSLFGEEDEGLSSTTDGQPPTERFVSERATMIQAAMCLQHTMRTSAKEKGKRRTLGFIDSIDSVNRLGRQLGDAEWQDIGKFELDKNTLPKSCKPPLYTLRTPFGRPDFRKSGLYEAIFAASRDFSRPVPEDGFVLRLPEQDCPRLAGRNCQQPPHSLLERCDRYEDGECWFTMARDREEGLRPITLQMHQSGSRSWGVPALVGKKCDNQQKDRWRLLVTTSALEVGFDHPEIIATWQYHAPMSLAAFVQRKGRGGRGPRDLPVNMMVLGTGPSDRHCFRNHLRYVDPSSFPSYVDPENPSVRQQHLFSAVLDWCAKSGPDFDAAYSCDLDQLLAALSRQEARKYVQDCFPDMNGDVAYKSMEDLKNYITDSWTSSLRLKDVPLPPEKPVKPIDLFKGEYKHAIAAWIATLKDSTAPARSATPAWLRAAQGYLDTSPSRSMNIVDFCAVVPREVAINPDFRVPATTISIPIGRHIKISGAGKENDEAAEFALRSFLPGGFKIRYNGHYWMALWEPLRDKPTQFGGSWAAIDDQWITLPVPSLPTDANSLARECALTASATKQLLEDLGQDCSIRYVQELKVQDLGKGSNRALFLDAATKAVATERDPLRPSDFRPLTRDPNCAPCSRTLPLRAKDWSTVVQPGQFRHIESVRFHDSFRLVLIHYANLVHCYPAPTAGRPSEAETVAVHFYESKTRRRAAAAVELRTQALEFRIPVPEDSESIWGLPCRITAFWRRVKQRVLQELVVETGKLANIFLVDELLETLQTLECTSGQRVGSFLNEPPSSQRLVNACADLASRRFKRILEIKALSQELATILAGTAEWIRGPGFEVALGETLAAAFTQAAAGSIGVSPESLRSHVSCEQGLLTLFLYDDLDGGSGNARHLRDLLKQAGEALLIDELRRCGTCPAEAGDRAAKRWFDNHSSVESLVADFEERALRGLNIPEESWPRLRTMVDSVEIAAFNDFALRELFQLQEKLGGLPPDSYFAEHIRCQPALDERAEALRMLFSQVSDGVEELSSRLREVRPLCVSGCPECLVEDRYGASLFVDRRLLTTYLEFTERRI